MSKKHYSKFKIKDKVLRGELVRAHGMVILLVIALMSVLGLSNAFELVLDPVLTISAIFLLAVVGLLSLSVILALIKKR